MPEIVKILEQLPHHKHHTVKKSALINKIGSGGWNALHFAIYCKQIELINYFIEQECDLNALTHEFWTPL